MKTIKNAPFYLVIVAIVNKDFTHIGGKFTKGEELVIDQSSMTADYNTDEVCVLRRDVHKINLFRLPTSMFSHFSVKTIIPRFKVGDVVVNINGGSLAIPSVISSYRLCYGSIWYQDEFGDNNNLAHGNMEGDIRLATEKEKTKGIFALLNKSNG